MDGGATLDGRGWVDCARVSAGLLDDFSSAGAAFKGLFAFAGGLVAVDSPVGAVLSAVERPGCKTGFGDLADIKCLPPPGLEEKKEE